MVVEEQQSRPVTEIEERSTYEGPIVEDIEATEGPALPSAIASA